MAVVGSSAATGDDGRRCRPWDRPCKQTHYRQRGRCDRYSYSSWV